MDTQINVAYNSLHYIKRLRFLDKLILADRCPW